MCWAYALRTHEILLKLRILFSRDTSFSLFSTNSAFQYNLVHSHFCSRGFVLAFVWDGLCILNDI